jgi:hypothetical protein
MKSRHHLKVIVIVPTSPPDAVRNSRVVKKSIGKQLCTHTFSPRYRCARHLAAALELLRWLQNDDAHNNVEQLEILLLLFYSCKGI